MESLIGLPTAGPQKAHNTTNQCAVFTHIAYDRTRIRSEAIVTCVTYYRMMFKYMLG